VSGPPIEAAGIAHAKLLAAIHREAFSSREAWTEREFATHLAQPGVIALLHPGGGFVVLRIAADEAEILTIAVLPESRGRGVGTALLRAALAEARGRDVTAVYLEVAADNPAARSLYTRADFSPIGRRGRYYPGGIDAIIMRALLPRRAAMSEA